MRLLDLDLGRTLPGVPRAIVGEQWVLVRFHGFPMGILRLQDRDYDPREIREVAVSETMPRIVRHIVRDSLETARLDSLATSLVTGRFECPARPDPEWPHITVAVCTRDRASQLPACLAALLALDYPAERLDLLVVDNAPLDDSTERVVRERSPRLRYIREPRPGLDWARNRGVLEARGDIVAFTDDDVSVDPMWVRAIGTVFLEEPDLAAMTGLVVPDELDGDPQILFEEYGGFGRGVVRRYFQVDVQGGESAAESYGGTGAIGTGANMAFRRSVFDEIGLFDPALDVGTPTNGGGDLEMFYRVLQAGRLLVYEPSALVRHRHRREYAQLRTQLANNGIGFYSYLVRSARRHPDERRAFLRLGLWWFWYWNVRRLILSFLRRGGMPRDLILAELEGSLKGLQRYARARRQAEEVLRRFGPQVPEGSMGA